MTRTEWSGKHPNLGDLIDRSLARLRSSEETVKAARRLLSIERKNARLVPWRVERSRLEFAAKAGTGK